MKTTAIFRNLSDQFWNGFGDSIPAFLGQSPLGQFQRAKRLVHEMPGYVTLKVGNGSVRDAVEWNQLFRDSSHRLTAKIEPRKGYRLVTFEFNR